MPTLIMFAHGDSITVDDDYDRVNTQLHGDARGGQFKRVDEGLDARVTIYTANISYIQEHHEPEGPLVARG